MEFGKVVVRFCEVFPSSQWSKVETWKVRQTNQFQKKSSQFGEVIILSCVACGCPTNDMFGVARPKLPWDQVMRATVYDTPGLFY